MAKTVMVVDPSATLRQALRLTLTGAGYQVVDAQDGVEALAKSSACIVDLFLTDLAMPKMDGIELTRRLRATVPYRSTPIVLLAAVYQNSKKMEGKAAGATGWIVKPFQFEQVIALVKKVCR